MKSGLLQHVAALFYAVFDLVLPLTSQKSHLSNVEKEYHINLARLSLKYLDVIKQSFT